MPAGQLDFFSAARVNAVMTGVYDPRLMPQPLIWDKRIPSVPANDDEIMARFIGFPIIADLLVDDAKAATYSFGKFQFETAKIPKLKVGLAMNESWLRQLDRIQSGAAMKDEIGIFTDWERRAVSTVRYGVDIRREVLLLSMLFDGINYDRLGIKISNTFGMYSDLKVTPSTTWDQTSATPLTDIQTVRRTARVRYGIDLNRLTISTQTLLYISKTTEFQNQAKAFVTPFLFGGPAPAIPLQSDGYISQLLGRILGGVPGQEGGGIGPLIIELDDRRYWTQDSAGVVSSAPIHPIAGALLTSTALDGNASAWDFANGVLVESMVSRIVGGGVPAVPAGPGPIAYNTPSDVRLDPPGIVYWGVQRGFPRKHMLAASASITAGVYGDSISTATPF